jgi:chorismate mutase
MRASPADVSGFLSVRASLDLPAIRPQRGPAMAKPHDATPPELLELRHSIDNIDAALLHLLAERFKATRKVGALKAKLDMPPADPVREAQQIARLHSLAVTADLDPEFAEKFLNFLVKEVIRHHEIIRDGGDL